MSYLRKYRPNLIYDDFCVLLLKVIEPLNESQQTKSPLFLSENASFVAFIHELKFMVFGTQNNLADLQFLQIKPLAQF